MKLLRRYLPILDWGAKYNRPDADQRPDRGGDRHGHADPAVAGLRAAGRAAAAGGALRLDGAALALCGLRHLARAGGRAGGGGQPDDRGRGRPARGPGNAGVPGRRHRAGAASRGCCCSPWGCCGWGSSRTSSATRWSPASSPRRASRSRPASSAPVLGIRARARPSSSWSKSLVPNSATSIPQTAAIGLGSLAFLFWVRSGLKPLLLRFGLPRQNRRHRWRSSGRLVALVVTTAGRLGLRPRRAGRQDRRRRCRRACPRSPCRRSISRSGRRSSCPRCSSPSSATWSPSRSP